MLRRIIDTTIPIGCSIGVASAIFSNSLPSSVGQYLHGWMAFAWAYGLLVACVLIVLGVWLRYASALWSFMLEFIGLITTGILIVVYALAVLANFGASALVASGTLLSISSYFICRWLELNGFLSKARKKNKREP